MYVTPPFSWSSSSSLFFVLVVIFVVLSFVPGQLERLQLHVLRDGAVLPGPGDEHHRPRAQVRSKRFGCQNSVFDWSSSVFDWSNAVFDRSSAVFGCSSRIRYLIGQARSLIGQIQSFISRMRSLFGRTRFVVCRIRSLIGRIRCFSGRTRSLIGRVRFLIEFVFFIILDWSFSFFFLAELSLWSNSVFDLSDSQQAFDWPNEPSCYHRARPYNPFNTANHFFGDKLLKISVVFFCSSKSVKKQPYSDEPYDSNQNPQWTPKTMYSPMFTRHIWF